MLVVLAMLTAACGTNPVRPTSTTSSEEPTPSRAKADLPPLPEVVAVPDPRVGLAGIVATDLGEPIVGRPFITVDRDGERRDGVTGPGGALALEGLTPPYDLVVMGDGTTGPTALLGLARPDPHIELRERNGITNVARALTIRVGVLAPPCGDDRCVVDVVTTSLTGHGAASALSEPTVSGDTTAIVEVSHDWSAKRPVEGELLDVHALVHDRANTSFSYVRLGAFPAGEDADVGFVRATAVQTAEPQAIDPSEIVTLDAPGADGVPGASFTIGARVPLLEDASWRLEASAVSVPTALSLHRSSRVWSGSLSIGSAAPELWLPTAPELARPVAGGSLSARGAGLSWSARTAALFTVDIVDVGRGAFRYRILTNAAEIPFRRLEVLGLPRLQPGDHTIALSTALEIPLDDLASPDPAVRSRRFDERRAGGATYQRVPFVVAP